MNMSFSMEAERQNKFSFLDAENICKQDKITITIYRKPTFSGVYSNTESFFYFLFITLVWYTCIQLYMYKFYRCFCICSDWKHFYTKSSFLKRIFCKNSYPENFIDKCFKRFLHNIHIFNKKGFNSRKKPFASALFILSNYIFANQD